ncbi:hypothetical protein [Ferrimonas marina]|uniref:Uncharacterized protein n=1 Tax=Ferrimonas marina TaxID=299255 RepID=A0A1M5U3I4_9GAMM|nr:hypothetical protein [Ferrimonas marina]SHH57582.1 hypothetical protein SAMN02745129_2395 [Ferrimonas marina]
MPITRIFCLAASLAFTSTISLASEQHFEELQSAIDQAVQTHSQHGWAHALSDDLVIELYQGLELSQQCQSDSPARQYWDERVFSPIGQTLDASVLFIHLLDNAYIRLMLADLGSDQPMLSDELMTFIQSGRSEVRVEPVPPIRKFSAQPWQDFVTTNPEHPAAAVSFGPHSLEQHFRLIRLYWVGKEMLPSQAGILQAQCENLPHKARMLSNIVPQP